MQPKNIRALDILAKSREAHREVCPSNGVTQVRESNMAHVSYVTYLSSPCNRLSAVMVCLGFIWTFNYVVKLISMNMKELLTTSQSRRGRLMVLQLWQRITAQWESEE